MTTPADGHPVLLRVNGRDCSIHGDARGALLYALRNALGLTGARFGCGMGLCGACVVQVDGRPVFSCDTTLEQAAGQDIRTVEGLDDRIGRTLLAAFDRLQAGQCGYCLPGIIVRAHALLRQSQAVERRSISEALDRHLCRCGAHGRILDAIESAAGALRESDGD